MINGANVLDRDELIEHLDQVVTVSWTVYARGLTEQEYCFDRRAEAEENGFDWSNDLWWELFKDEVWRELRGSGMTILPGPVHRWTIGDSIFYTWPVGRP